MLFKSTMVTYNHPDLFYFTTGYILFLAIFGINAITPSVSLTIPSSSSSSSSSSLQSSAPTHKIARCPSSAEVRHRNKHLRFGVILPFYGDYEWRLDLVRPAIELAKEYITREKNLLQGFTIDFDYRDSNCSVTRAPLEAIDMYATKSVDVFLGPVCDYAIAPIARYAPTWGIPIITAGALVNNFGNKKQYKLLTRLMGGYAKTGEFLLSVLKNFDYAEVGMMFDRHKDKKCLFTIQAILEQLQNHLNKNLGMKNVVYFDENEEQFAEKPLKTLSQKCRVVVLCGSPHSVREIMIKAHDLNFDNGEYVFFNIDLFTSKYSSEYPWYDATDTPERNEKAKKGYEALLSLTLRKPTSQIYRQFSNEVKTRAHMMNRDFTYGEDEVNSFVCAFHDAVILYALALNESLRDNISISNGAEITARMWNRTFTGITGTVSIDDNGDRNVDYSLLDMDPRTNKFRVVADYFGSEKKYVPVVGVPIYWAGGRTEPPPDTPKCGFDGSRCPPDGSPPPGGDATLPPLEQSPSSPPTSPPPPTVAARMICSTPRQTPAGKAPKQSRLATYDDLVQAVVVKSALEQEKLNLEIENAKANKELLAILRRNAELNMESLLLKRQTLQEDKQ